MGTLFMVNPPARGKKAKKKKRRTAKQKAATKKMQAARKKKIGGKKQRKRKISPSQGGRMARKKKKATGKRRTKRATKRRSPVTSLRRHAVYQTNPRRRRRNPRRRGSYRGNPSIARQLQQGAMDAGATLVGGALARTATGILPLPKEGVAGAAAGVGVALLVGFAARKVVSADTARFITAGAMQVPIKNLITTFIPQAGAFLGDYDNIGAYALPSAGVGDYLNPGSMYGYEGSAQDSMSAYE